MAWRPNEQFVEGELDNTQPGKVTGWMRFAGLNEHVTFDLEGDFHRDIRGAKVRLRGTDELMDPQKAENYMKGFSLIQKGKAGDMTAGLPPYDYIQGYGYFEWYGVDNGRVVLELEPSQIEIIGTPIPACESDPINRNDQAKNMANYLTDLASELGLPIQNTIAVGDTAAIERAKQILANDKIRGMRLLPKELREILPPLGSQDGKGGKAIVYAKFFHPASSWSWYITEGQPYLDDSNREIDYEFFGLVDGAEREYGYFVLSELELVRDRLGLPMERDLFWKPTPLEEILPEMFSQSSSGGAHENLL